MSVISEIRASLDAMGVEQQVCVFVFLVSYPLTLGALFEARGRRYAAACAALGAVGFVCTTSPWMHAVLLLVLAIGAIGVFIAMVYGADLAYRRMARPLTIAEPALQVDNVAASHAPSGRELLPLQTVPVKT